MRTETRKIINIQGKKYFIDLKKNLLINVNNKNKVLEIREDEMHYFKEVGYAFKCP